MKSVICAVFTLLVLLLGIDGAKILSIFPPPAKSHNIQAVKLMTELASRGHEITFVTPWPLKTPVKNIKEIVIDAVSEEVSEFKKQSFFNNLDSGVTGKLEHVYTLGQIITEATFKSLNVQDLLISDEKFDLVILEIFVNEAMLGIAHHFKAPVIAFSPVGANIWVNGLVGNPAPMSYISDLIEDLSLNMSLSERLQNMITSVTHRLYLEFVHYPHQDRILHMYLPEAPSLKQLLYSSVDLVLLNSHVSIGIPQPHTPGMKEIGGFHIPEVKELPEDLKKILDKASEGVILFSLGSFMESQAMPKETRDNILKTFGKLEQKVIWKWEGGALSRKPQNVFTHKWLPQNDILAHPNVKLFITHGGILSMTETVYHGVPIVGIPVFADQHANMNLAVELKIGRKVNYANLTEESLTAAITEVLTNPIYRTNVRKRSHIMRDQPLKPIDKAIFWIEHTIRHKGARHFRTKAMSLAWYELYNLDIFAMFFFSFWAAFKIFSLIMRPKDEPKYKGEIKRRIK